MKRPIRMLMLAVMFFAFCGTAIAQVTTGGLTGFVKDSKGAPLPGAFVKVTHEPSGTVYHATTRANGHYSILGIRVGSQYKVEASFMGLQAQATTDLSISLGDPVTVDFQLNDDEGTELQAATVVAVKKSAFGTDKTGATTNISNREMKLMPTLNRNLSDYTKISPYSTGGNSFGGREAYTSNITVDGANFNNNFGISGSGMPGVSGEPISMDAIEEMQVAVAPYDVRQSNFTGASVNAVTKSGTNTYKGTVYGYYRNQNFNGTKIRDKELTVNNSSKNILGFSLGGPIIKNKLFLFVNGEMENSTTPGNTLQALAPGRDVNDPNVSSRVQASDLQKFSDILQTKYGYSTGRYENWGGDDTYNNKLLARLDWNINKNHKFTLRYNFSNASFISRPSSSGDASPSLSPTGGFARHTKAGGISFENTQYSSTSKLHSVTAELHSRIGQQASNHFLVAYTNYNQPRETNSSMFPFIDIMSGDATKGDVYMSAGYELFSYHNIVKNNTLILTNNFTYNLNKHTLTAGVSYENQELYNSYLRQGSGYYRFKDLTAFERFTNGEGIGKAYNPDYHPTNFAFTYPINGYADPAAELTFGQFSAYVQDEWNVVNGFKLTAGLRIDVPIYLDGAVDNPAVKNYSFRDGETVDLSSWPKTRILWSPRLGFNWDVFKNKDLVVRGGTGIFTGRIPFVWFTNQPSNSGMLQYQLVMDSGNTTYGPAYQSALAKLPLLPNSYDLLNDPAVKDIFPTQNPAGGRIAVIDKDFRLPQVWRTSLATDIKLPLNMMLTLEGVFSKDINSIYFDNINIKSPNSKIIEGDKVRDYYTNKLQYITTPYSNVVVMRNTDEGKSASLSAQLTLPRMYGFSGMLAYGYNYADEITGKNGSDPFSAWQYRQTVQSLNTKEIGLTLNNTPHKVVAAVNYSISYAKYFATTVSVFYNGYQGGAYSYVYNGSGRAMNDGVSTNLMYIPRTKDDFIWKNGDAEAEAYFAYAAQDPYLSKHAGEYMERYAAYLPWNSRFDLRFMQDFKLNVGRTQNTLQFSVDVINFANLLNSSWGLAQSLAPNANAPLRYESRDAATGRMVVSMTKDAGGNYLSKSYQDPTSVEGTWAIQLGLRYIFN